MSPARLVFTTPSRTLIAGACPGAANEIRVELQSAGGAPTPAGPAGQTFTVTTSSPGVTRWYATPACLTPVSGTFTIAAGNSSVAVFYSDTRVGTASISLSNPSGLITPAAQSHTIVAGAPAGLVFTSPPRTLPALTCSSPATTIQVQDAFANPTAVTAAVAVTLGRAPAGLNGRTFSTASCVGSVNSVVIPTGATEVPVYFSAENAGTLTLTASAPGLAGATQGHVVTPALPSALVLSTVASPAETGACSSVRVARQDALLRPATPPSPTAANLGAAPTGLQFFSDAACLTPITAASIPAGASFTDFFVKGTTGATFEITASATGLTSGTLPFQSLPMVRRGSCDLAAGDLSTTCPLVPAIPSNDLSRTFLVFAASSGSNRPDEANVRCRLVGGGGGAAVSCARLHVGGFPATVAWQTVSFARSFANGGVSVQHLETSVAAGTGSPLGVPIAAVDPSRTFLLFSSTAVGVDNAGDDLVTAQVTPSQVQFRVRAALDFGTMDLSTQVVSFAGANVLRGTVTASPPASLVTVSGLPAPGLNRAFALMTHSQDEGPAATNLAICKRRYRGVVSGTSLTFTRGNGVVGDCADTTVNELAWARVELPVGSLVQSTTVVHPPGAVVGSSTIATAVDSTRSIVFMAGQGLGGQASGEGDYSADDLLAAVVGIPSVSGTTVTVTRTVPGLGAATFTPFVVQFAP